MLGGRVHTPTIGMTAPRRMEKYPTFTILSELASTFFGTQDAMCPLATFCNGIPAPYLYNGTYSRAMAVFV